ncbi:MAG: Fic family protein [Treponema sp.]|uniref:Fic family protein n=1 Tax=Treponema sp. TaxID=166 RepID=UPI00298D8354|nr:Fic family protein [Treponema sp.]MDD5811818.1 Fic family protein [Treponema sp.]
MTAKDLKTSLKEEIDKYNSLGINQQLDYDKFYLYSIITHSTAIEGSTVTEVENQLLFDEGITSSKRTITEQMMNLDLKNAYEKSFEYAKNHEKLTVEMLCKLSSILMQNTGTEYNTIAGSFSSAKGELRLVNVSAGRGGKSYLAWQKVPDRLQKTCDYLNRRRSEIDKNNIEEIYKLSFEAHYLLVSIHPWADGNGRMSRLIMNMIQKEFDVIPSIVKKENRVEYIQSLASSQVKDDMQDFMDFMMNHHIQNLLQQINEYSESLDDDTLNYKNDTLNDTLKLSPKEITVLEIIKSNLTVTTAQIVEQTGFSRPTVMRAIKNLKENKILERVDSKKTGSWKVNV